MRLATFDDDRVGIINQEQIVDVTDVVRAFQPSAGMSTMRALIQNWPALQEQLVGQVQGAQGLEAVRLQPPVPDPTKIIAAPVNYMDHMSEMNEDSHVSSLGFFLKAPSSLLAPEGTVELPYTDRRFDQEGELALIIGRKARNVSEDEALDYVFGYTGLLDITMRGGEDRSTRKSFETFTPMGPWLVTSDEFGSPTDVDLQCSVSGQIRQKANTSDLIWGVAKLVSYASSVTTLEPGDVITTGTPAGVGPIKDGDSIELELSGVGRLTVQVSAANAVACPTKGAGKGPVPPPPLA